jgi:hypothetical protein
VSDDPDDIWRESVKLTVSLNGQDYDEESSEVDFTFVGTGSTLVFWPYVLGTLIIGMLLVAIITFCAASFQQISFNAFAAKQSARVSGRSYVVRDETDQFTTRAYPAGMVQRDS